MIITKFLETSIVIFMKIFMGLLNFLDFYEINFGCLI